MVFDKNKLTLITTLLYASSMMNCSYPAKWKQFRSPCDMAYSGPKIEMEINKEQFQASGCFQLEELLLYATCEKPNNPTREITKKLSSARELVDSMLTNWVRYNYGVTGNTPHRSYTSQQLDNPKKICIHVNIPRLPSTHSQEK